MYKKKRAMTLLEVVIYLGLLSVVITLFSVSTVYFKEKQYEIESQNELFAIRDFIIDAKLTSRKLNQSGILFIFDEKDFLTFMISQDNKNFLKLERFILDTGTNKNLEIIINGRRPIDRDYKFYVEDKMENRYKFKISEKGAVEFEKVKK